MTQPPWSARTLSTSELIDWLQIHAGNTKHLTVIVTQNDDTIDVRSSTQHRDCPSKFRELSAHLQALSSAAFLCIEIKDRAIQP
jgi:hypothetical protein